MIKNRFLGNRFVVIGFNRLSRTDAGTPNHDEAEHLWAQFKRDLGELLSNVEARFTDFDSSKVDFQLSSLSQCCDTDNDALVVR